jgi:predicted lipoprotein with Yx(FWY)xxD motif
MTIRSSRRLLAPLLLTLAAAGCGGAAAAQSGSPATGVPDATVAAKSTKLGTILVDADGRTLYLFEKDKGPSSTCYGACASAWPPVTTDAKAIAGTGIDAAKLGTSRRKDGVTEVTYGGHPLYTYAGDAKPGDTTGQDISQFGAPWYVLAPTGQKIGG